MFVTLENLDDNDDDDDDDVTSIGPGKVLREYIKTSPKESLGPKLLLPKSPIFFIPFGMQHQWKLPSAELIYKKDDKADSSSYRRTYLS
jgi:hypothetical protein